MISIVYAYNVADNHRADGEVSPPRIDQELAGTVCAAGSLPLPADIRLLGRRPAGCFVERNGVAVINAIALYDLEQSPAEGPDHCLIVALETTPERLVADLNVFKTVAAGIQVCRPSWSKRAGVLQPCPAGGRWW